MTTTAGTTWAWWGKLVGINAIDLVMCVFMFVRSARDRNPADARCLKRMRTPGLVYIAVAFYRSMFVLPIEYWPSALAQLRMPNPEPAFRFGFQAVRDAFFIARATRGVSAWGGIGFLIWDAGYFSLCGRMVLFLMTGPRRSAAEK